MQRVQRKKQFREIFTDIAKPANFDLSQRCGMDGLVHLVRTVLEFDSGTTLLSIDGMGAFDHISRARIFTQL